MKSLNLLTITISLLIGSQPASAINWLSLITFGYYRQPNRLKEEYFPRYFYHNKNDIDLLNNEEESYIKQLFPNTDPNVIKTLSFAYDKTGNIVSTIGICEDGRTIIFGPFFCDLNKKSKIFALQHELGHMHGGHHKFKVLNRKNYPRLFTLTGVIGAGLFALATNYGITKNHILLRTVLAWPIGCGMAKSIFAAYSTHQSHKKEYFADTYAAFNCPDHSYIQAIINTFNAEERSKSDLLEKCYLAHSKKTSLAYFLWKKILLLHDLRTHPSFTSRIKNLKKIMKIREQEEAKNAYQKELVKQPIEKITTKE